MGGWVGEWVGGRVGVCVLFDCILFGVAKNKMTPQLSHVAMRSKPKISNLVRDLSHALVGTPRSPWANFSTSPAISETRKKGSFLTHKDILSMDSMRLAQWIWK